MRDRFAERHDSHASWQPDPEIVAVAVRQHGVISLTQLRALGLGRGAIQHRVRRRRLHRIHPEIYSVGHPVLSREARWMAAALAGGADAVLSHWSAASLWRLRSGTGPRSHVTVPRRRRSTAAITFHYAELADDEVSEKEGIPVTTPARTLIDLAPHMTIPSLTRALEQIERLRLHARPSIPELLGRYPRRAGTPALRRVIGTPNAMTRSDLEARFLHMIREWDLPRPEMNMNIEGFEVDCVWPDHRVIVELDAFETHGTSVAFERDRERDRKLQAAGWTVVRITRRQLDDEAEAIRADLARLLRR